MKQRGRSDSRSGRAALPSMTDLLADVANDSRFAGCPKPVLADALRGAVDVARQDADTGPVASPAKILDRAADILARRKRQRLQRVINATGIVLHTNLGRAPLAEPAIRRIAETAAGYCNLEFDLDTGERGRRGEYVERLLIEQTGAEAVLVVNNNASATMLVLAAVAAGREVVVSRGQLIEIGGSFRLPEVMVAGGATLREVGTTNKTHLRDYEQAIVPGRTGLIMHVHTSNYRVVGFVESPSTSELAEMAHRCGLWLYDDLGSGALGDDPLWRAAAEPTVAASLRAGADLVSFSGDKLLGGPQAGILVGRGEAIERLRSHPMTRALRVDKLVLAALGATLELHAMPDPAAVVPTLAMLRADPAELHARAEKLAGALSAACGDRAFEVIEQESFAGGGSLPAWPMPTAVVRWRPVRISAADAARRLREHGPPIVARVSEGSLWFDVRTLRDAEFAEIAAAVAALERSPPGS